MSSLILHGVYDHSLIQSIKSSGIIWGVDFRARSPQFLPFHEFKKLSTLVSPVDEIVISFENEKLETINSFIDLIENENLKATWSLNFRDQNCVSYYQQISKPFSWFFHSSCEWREIMSLKNLKRIILPVNLAADLSTDFWDLADGREIEVVLHFNSFQELFSFKNINRDVCVSIDLTSEIEFSYRRPNLLLIQTYLKSLDERAKLGAFDESTAGK